MQQIAAMGEVTRLIRNQRGSGRSVGFVPTMGFLHRGHLELIRRARRENDFVVVSIFVNPIQFEPGEDLEEYPRDLKNDLAACRTEKVDMVFAPSGRDMYPAGFKTFVEVESLGRWLCGRSRPTHFRGVTTVCAKLFEIVRADRAYFGQKDYQQAVIIRRMATDLNVPTEVVLCPIVRDENGLALSSRNAYMTEDQRRNAAIIYRGLQEAIRLYQGDEHSPEVIIRAVTDVIDTVPEADIEYVEVVDAEILEPVKIIRKPVVVAVAVHLGRARLIDNVILGHLPWADQSSAGGPES